MKKLLVAVALSAGLLAPGVGGAAPPDEVGAFGRHVAQCAREHGFDGEHNPGMHHGAMGWNGEQC